jgi:hypothetical protein
VSRRLGDQIVLVHMGTNQMFQLNETSARLWELLAEDGDVAAAERRLAAEYDVGAAQLRSEVDATLELLQAQRLLQGDERG